MSLPAEKFRELVFQVLYSGDFVPLSEEKAASLVASIASISKSNVRAVVAKALTIRSHFPELDAKIIASSKEYEFARIPRVEKNILRLAVYELLFEEEVPPKVTISEAIRICRKFSTDSSRAFVNAILDHIYHSLQPQAATI